MAWGRATWAWFRDVFLRNEHLLWITYLKNMERRIP